MGWNKRALEEMVNESATDLEKKALSDAALLLNNNTREWREERCSDDCLQNNTMCFDTKWEPILTAFVKVSRRKTRWRLTIRKDWASVGGNCIL